MKIGIIGQGFVGGTLYKALSKMGGDYEVRAHDKDPERSRNTLEEVAECDVVMVAVPTPMSMDTGECHTNIVERVIADLRQKNANNFIVIKSTVIPGTTERLNFSYGNIGFSPEFLTEANSYNDFVNLPYQILGYGEESQLETEGFCKLQKIFFDAHSQGVMACAKVYSVNARIAEMAKYTRNAYLATRLSFFNEMKQICDKLKIPYDELKYFAGLDPRVGQHYNRIDEDEPEFSGSCLVKDLNALTVVAKSLGIDPKMLSATWTKNLEVAKKRTWEEMEGRAVIKRED